MTTPGFPPLTLAEELLLLSLSPRSGRVAGRSNINLGVAGAVLAGLECAGAVQPEDDKGRRFVRVTRVKRASPTGDPLLDEALEGLGPDDRPRTGVWLRRRSRARADRAFLARLEDRGVLRAEQSRLLGLFPVASYRVLDATLVPALRARLETEPGRLGALVAAVRLERRLYRGGRGRETRKRLRGAVRGDWVAAAVLRVIRSREAASTSAAANAGG